MIPSDVPAKVREDPATGSKHACTHERLQALGVGGRAAYYRCAGCGQVFIEQDRRVWTLRPISAA
jgi:hypothetical protein